MAEGDDALIEQLRAFGVSAEELELLVRKAEEEADEEAARGAGDVVPPPPPPPGAFEPLGAPGMTPSGSSTASFASGEIGDAEVNRMRERALAEAKDAAAQIRASAIRLVSEKLQAAEDEVMALRVRAADEIAKLRADTARAMVARLREAEVEARALKNAARGGARLLEDDAAGILRIPAAVGSGSLATLEACLRHQQRGGKHRIVGLFDRRSVSAPPRRNTAGSLSRNLRRRR